MAKDPMVGARIPQEYIDEIDALCEATGRSRSQIILEAVEAYLGKSLGSSIQSELATLKRDLEGLKKGRQHLLHLEAS